MVTKPSQRRKRAPDWAMSPFEYFLDEAEHLSEVVRLSSIGINMIQSSPRLIDGLMRVKGDSSKNSKQRLEKAKKDSAFANKEVKTGFPILHAWAVVGLWALLEASVRNFIGEWLLHRRTAWRAEPIQQLKVRLGTYESLPRNQRQHFIVELLERELSANMKAGVSRFEAMLKPFDLSGDIPERLRRQMFEFSQVRNVIAHNAGKIDRKFLESCPWFKAEVGKQLHVSRDMLSQYLLSSAAYVTLIICRVGEGYGVNMSTEKEAIFESWNNTTTGNPS